jgi:RES domain-containing protein
VVDLSAGFDAEHWPTLWADFALDWRAEWFDKASEPPTWYMADDVVAASLDGILFPSQARPGGTNLVIYRSSVRPASQLRVYDPDGALQGLPRR